VDYLGEKVLFFNTIKEVWKEYLPGVKFPITQIVIPLYPPKMPRWVGSQITPCFLQGQIEFCTQDYPQIDFLGLQAFR